MSDFMPGLELNRIFYAEAVKPILDREFPALQYSAALIGVGAAFDFHSGNVKWAPNSVRKLGLEWAYRLAQNPRGMWRRNFDSPLFLSRVMWQRLSMILGGQYKTSPSGGEAGP